MRSLNDDWNISMNDAIIAGISGMIRHRIKDPIARVIFSCIYSVNDCSLPFNVSTFCFVSFNANGNVITIASDIEIPIANISRNGSIFFGMKLISVLSAR